ncbi:MAG: hypothetical protein KGI30_11055, partial [Planctomycetota bacterium]|nr:hypothetical protein [Planctomycetota bacterium]
ELKFGSSVPFIGTKSVTSVANGVVQNVTYKYVGIILKLTASVAENRNVMIDVYIENSAMVKDGGVEGNPIFTMDSVKTGFVIPDMTMCILGGVKTSNRGGGEKGFTVFIGCCAVSFSVWVNKQEQRYSGVNNCRVS